MITVISDSHIPGRAEKIPEKFWEKIEDSEITVHAGDYASEEVYNAVREYSNKVFTVKGNCDFFEADGLEESQIFDYKGLRFGVYHGTGIAPRGHVPTLEKIALKDLEVNVLIHGHTHKEDVHNSGEVLLLNPGSCTGVGGGSARPSNPTMMILEIKDDTLKAEILEMKESKLIQIESHKFSIKEIKK